MERKGLYRSRGNKRKRRGREERRSASSSLCASLFLFLSFSLLLSLSLPISIASATTVGSTECLASLPQGTQVNLLFFSLTLFDRRAPMAPLSKVKSLGGDREGEQKKRGVIGRGESVYIVVALPGCVFASTSVWVVVFYESRVCVQK